MPQILHTDGLDATQPSTRAMDEQFCELLCADEDLLRAEFDAIIAAEWPSPATGRTIPWRRRRATPTPSPATSQSQRRGATKSATPPWHRRVDPATLIPRAPGSDNRTPKGR
jgi:hypothetical protein